MKKIFIYFIGCSKCKKQFTCIPTENGGQKPDYSGFKRDSWTPRSGREHKESAARTKAAETDAERSNLESAGVRWTELFRLDYFCPIQNHLIDPLHCLYLGIAKTMTKHYLKTKLISKQHLGYSSHNEQKQSSKYGWEDFSEDRQWFFQLHS